MKFYLILILFISHNVFLQEKEVNIEEVVVKRIPKIETIIERLQRQLKKNCDSTSFVYKLRQQNFKNEDTIIYRNENQKISIENLTGNFKRKNLIENKNNWSTKFKTFFSNYDAKEIPIGWLSGFPVRNNLNIATLDFLVNLKQYFYQTKRNIDDQIEIEFTSKNYLKGKFVVDEKYNLISLEYSNIEPFPFYHKSVNNDGLPFSSNWIYNKQKVVIQFQILNKKIKLKSLEIEEYLKDFVFKRFDQKNNISFQEQNNFKTLILISDEN